MAQIDPLAIAKFNVDSFNARVDAQVKLSKAYADFNFRMAEVVEKQIEAAIKGEKLNAMRVALCEYERALSQCRQRQRSVEHELDLVNQHIKDVRAMVSGESLYGAFVPHVWIGMAYFMQQVSSDVSMKIAAIPVPSEARKGIGFSHNSSPAEPCVDAPPELQYLGQLVAWLTRKSYMPRIGSPAWLLLGDALSEFEKFAASRAKDDEQRLAGVEKELKEIQEVSWTTLDYGKYPAKSATDEKKPVLAAANAD